MNPNILKNHPVSVVWLTVIFSEALYIGTAIYFYLTERTFSSMWKKTTTTTTTTTTTPKPGVTTAYDGGPDNSVFWEPYQNPMRLGAVRFNLLGLGLILFRLFGRYRKTLLAPLLHFLIALIVLIEIIEEEWKNILRKEVWNPGEGGDWMLDKIICIIFIAFWCSSIQTFVFRPGQTESRRKIYKGFHALFGVLTWTLLALGYMNMVTRLSIQYHNMEYKDKESVVLCLTIHMFAVVTFTVCIIYIIINPYFGAGV